MKNAVVFTFLFGFSFLVYAGPFGLEKGMTIEQVKLSCGGIDPQNIKDDSYLLIPDKKHPFFETYIVYINEKIGLYYIRAISYEIITSKYGTEIKKAFNDIEQRISMIYGGSTKVDNIHKDSNWGSEDAWMYALSQGDREYFSYWVNKEIKLPDELDGIELKIIAKLTTKGYIILEYQFNNFQDVKELEDSVF